jgi:peptide methionine sulfoxide reductase MsrA
LQVVYDPKKITYEKLLEVYWRNIDPLASMASSAISQPVPLGAFYHDAR